MPKSKNKIISHIQPSLFTLTPDSKIFVPSKYQSDIFDWAKFSTLGDCVVEACPGSGKTTVVVETARILFTDRTLRTLFCAFNKHIVEELKDKLPKKMRITTIHGLGKGCLYKVKKPYLLKTK